MRWEPRLDTVLTMIYFPHRVRPLSNSFVMGLYFAKLRLRYAMNSDLISFIHSNSYSFKSAILCFAKDFFVKMFLWFKHKTSLISVSNHNKAHATMINCWAPPLLFPLPFAFLFHSNIIQSNTFKSITLSDFGLARCPRITHPKSGIPLTSTCYMLGSDYFR